MAEPINLNKVRKDRAKAAARTQAAENRAAFGRTKSEKALIKAKADKIEAILDGAKRQPQPDPKPER